MHVISPRRCRAFWQAKPEQTDAEGPLRAWIKAAEAADWKSLADVRTACPSADAVPLKDRPTATIFNIGGNKYRLAALVDYEGGVIYVKRVMTHREYDKNKWHSDFYPVE